MRVLATTNCKVICWRLISVHIFIRRLIKLRTCLIKKAFKKMEKTRKNRWTAVENRGFGFGSRNSTIDVRLTFVYSPAYIIHRPNWAILVIIARNWTFRCSLALPGDVTALFLILLLVQSLEPPLPLMGPLNHSLVLCIAILSRHDKFCPDF